MEKRKRAVTSIWDGGQGLKAGSVGEVTIGSALNEWDFDYEGCFLSKWKKQGKK